ncbi:SMC-Scp complex subunit ScpB [Taibaiella sp. KBW10]|uniref:SMC-Scp complex subunit ScpB n=1 Tax=Taibaiella sp. KBW10 TaxID=2153357 RepID=UPI000F5A0EF9|nr:SMC-Scp complex subunit ScpB [Taibaiella sp. KBW10]RQO30420.1 SMC-Scp complex subunit ScpB [Taibaiella sp. KBW10]
MELEQLILHVEALVFSSQQPLTQVELIELMSNVTEVPIPGERIALAIETVKEKYDTPHYPFQLTETGGGYQFLTKAAYHQTIMQLNGDKYIKKLSSAAMETLSIIAYKQPVTKSEIEFIRGVSADYSIQKLLEKELIVIAGRNEEAIGKPLIYATSKHFMDYLGINAPDQLPKLKEVASMEIVFPTDAAEAAPEAVQQMAVGDDGMLKTIE